MDKDKNCYNCAYKQNIPSNCHKQCIFDFSKSDKRVNIHLTQWSASFPYNYDPIWINSCEAHSTERDENLVRKNNPLGDLLSLLG